MQSATCVCQNDCKNFQQGLGWEVWLTVVKLSASRFALLEISRRRLGLPVCAAYVDVELLLLLVVVG